MYLEIYRGSIIGLYWDVMEISGDFANKIVGV